MPHTLLHRHSFNERRGSCQPLITLCNTVNTTVNPLADTVVDMSPSILQLQAQAASGTKPIPIASSPKSKREVSPNTVSSAGSSSSSTRNSFDVVRCSRCQRSMSFNITTNTQASGVVRFGLNSYYCARCANVVGFVK